MKRFVVLIGILILNACQSSAPTPTATLTFAPAATVVPKETTTPQPVNESTSTLEIIEGGWSTFQAQEYDFQFRYPAVYDKGFYDPVDPLTFCNLQTKKEDANFNIWVGQIWILVNENDQSLEDIVDDYVKEIGGRSAAWEIRSQTHREIDGLPSTTVEYGRKRPPRWGKTTFLIHENDLLTIRYYEGQLILCGPPDTSYSSYWVYEQILNTLKFDH